MLPKILFASMLPEILCALYASAAQLHSVLSIVECVLFFSAIYPLISNLNQSKDKPISSIVITVYKFWLAWLIVLAFAQIPAHGLLWGPRYFPEMGKAILVTLENTMGVDAIMEWKFFIHLCNIGLTAQIILQAFVSLTTSRYIPQLSTGYDRVWRYYLPMIRNAILIYALSYRFSLADQVTVIH